MAILIYFSIYLSRLRALLSFHALSSFTLILSVCSSLFAYLPPLSAHLPVSLRLFCRLFLPIFSSLSACSPASLRLLSRLSPSFQPTSPLLSLRSPPASIEAEHFSQIIQWIQIGHCGFHHLNSVDTEEIACPPASRNKLYWTHRLNPFASLCWSPSNPLLKSRGIHQW